MIPAIEVELISSEIVEGTSWLSPDAYIGYTYNDILSILNKNRKRDSKPLNIKTLRRRISWINRAIPWFYWQGKATPYQLWVIIKYHTLYYPFGVTVVSHRLVAEKARTQLNLFTLETYHHETGSSTQKTQSESRQICKSIASIEP